ncbi:hypothetical protein BOMU111920_16000 [Bordetella muralis]
MTLPAGAGTIKFTFVVNCQDSVLRPDPYFVGTPLVH